MTALNKQALIAKIKKHTESFDTVVLKEDEANALLDELEAAEKRIAELEAREQKNLAEERQRVIDGLCTIGETAWEIEEYMKEWDAKHPHEAATAGIGVKGE